VKDKHSRFFTIQLKHAAGQQPTRLDCVQAHGLEPQYPVLPAHTQRAWTFVHTKCQAYISMQAGAPLRRVYSEVVYAAQHMALAVAPAFSW